MLGIFEVFANTIVICTLIAFAILPSGLIDLQTGEVLIATQPTALVSKAFGTFFYIGNIKFGSIFIAIAILFFAFATILGWSYYGTKAWKFLFGTRSIILYKCIFVFFLMVGATMELDLVWKVSDIFNGLMALSGTVVQITKERDG